MKLKVLHEQEDAFGQWLKEKMKRRIEKGDSRLKGVLHGEQYTLTHVQTAIKQSVCLRNLGPTYLEQTISNILRDMVQNNELPVTQLNDARIYFGLSKMTPGELRQEKARKKKGQI